MEIYWSCSAVASRTEEDTRRRDAGVFPFQNGGDRAGWFLRIALRQQVGILVPVTEKTLGGSIVLYEGQMADYSESYFAPGSNAFSGHHLITDVRRIRSDTDACSD
jgi:hypothetical protein